MSGLPNHKNAETALEHAEGMADALGDESWRSWTQEQASEVEEVLDSLRRMVRDRDAELRRAERALEHEDRKGMDVGEAAEHLVWQYHEACESEQVLLEIVRRDNERVAHQQAIHEQDMEQDGRARAMMVALCRDLDVPIYTDATRGIRDEMHRRNELLRRCYDWWGLDDVGRLVYSDLCRHHGMPADAPDFDGDS